MVRLQELRRAFGGTLHEDRDRRWLDTQMGGLRVWIAYREHAGRRRYELAVFTPGARELAPFTEPDGTSEWQHETPHALPSLQHGFVFAGCRRGVLLATYGGEPALEDLVGTLWELGRWARETWGPRKPERVDRVWVDRLKRLAIVVVLIAALWLLGGR